MTDRLIRFITALPAATVAAVAAIRPGHRFCGVRTGAESCGRQGRGPCWMQRLTAARRMSSPGSAAAWSHGSAQVVESCLATAGRGQVPAAQHVAYLAQVPFRQLRSQVIHQLADGLAGIRSELVKPRLLHVPAGERQRRNTPPHPARHREVSYDAPPVPGHDPRPPRAGGALRCPCENAPDAASGCPVPCQAPGRGLPTRRPAGSGPTASAAAAHQEPQEPNAAGRTRHPAERAPPPPRSAALPVPACLVCAKKRSRTTPLRRAGRIRSREPGNAAGASPGSRSV